MKRCPKCSFLYLDTDEVCDLDGTPLVQLSESDLAGSLTPTGAPLASEPSEASAGSKRTLFTALGGLLLGVMMFIGYFLIARRPAAPAPLQQPVAKVTTPSSLQPFTSPAPIPSATVEPSPSPTEKASPSQNIRTARASISNNPVSTTASQNSPETQVLIRLTNGAQIEADEVWRTKEGVWYRRHGLVTLLKANRVKSIEKNGRK